MLLLLAPAAVSQLTLDPGAQMITDKVRENNTMTLYCPGTSVISRILFASYGTPYGTGLEAATGNCHATTSLKVMNSNCIQQPTCSVEAINEFVFTDPCVGTGKDLVVTAQCSPAKQTLVSSPDAEVIHTNVSGNEEAKLICSSGVMTKILFASYGDPVNIGMYATVGTCNASNSFQIVSDACLSKSSCKVTASSS
nr:secreted protein [Achlya hypogyna]